VIKYAEVIGVASRPISVGEHVHVHNVESVRARGDKTVGEQS
jgi:altronate dehydratase small subunit